ncbi:hypothetical protein [Nocardia sp. NPDC060259]|uniref:hypothetical protein n=1 Tax=Nocardia sp. NPDC060259 TaxID=3347088 RepID=UPI00364AA713
MAGLKHRVNVIADEADRGGEDVNDEEYSKAIRLFRSLTGRVPDHYLGVAYGLVHNEDAMAVQAVVLGLDYDGIGVTGEEWLLVRDLLEVGDLQEDELHISLLDIPPTLAYSFTPDAPEHIPEPLAADRLMAMSVAGRGVTAVRRVYRSPKHAAANPASWLYLVETEVGVEEARLSDYLSSQLWHELQEKQLVETYPAGAVLPTYHSAALAASKLLWP